MASATYKLAFNGNTLTYPSWTGYCSYVPEKTRYEYTIFGSPTAVGVSAGTVSMPFSAFDQIGIRTCWKNGLDNYGSNIWWINPTGFKSVTGQYMITYNFANGTYYQMMQQQFNYNNTAKTFECPYEGTSAWRCLITPVTSNAKFQGQNYSTNKLALVGQIIGVKYQ